MCILQAFLRNIRLYGGERSKLTILDNVSGIIRPSRYFYYFCYSFKKFLYVLFSYNSSFAFAFCRLTLLLGPPSSGKTTLLLSLAGRLGNSLQVQTTRVIAESCLLCKDILLYVWPIFFLGKWKTSGKITYNGYNLKEIVAPRTSAYVSQQDWHVAEMTVRQNLEFAGRCQGVGFKYGK